MAAFKFRLEPVLKLKEKTEELRKKELAQLKELLKKEEEFLKLLEQKRLLLIEKIKKEQNGIIEVEKFLNSQQYLNHLRENIVSQLAKIKELIKAIELKRQDLIAASKERKKFEKLKDNQYKKFIKETERLETNFLDQIGMINYNHRNGDR